MSASPESQTLLTAKEFWKLPGPSHRGRMELVEGRVVEATPVGRLHARLAGRLVKALSFLVDEHGPGEVHVELGHRTATSPDSVRAPGVSYLGAHRLSDLPSDGFVPGAPTLAIEIMSPGDSEADAARKVEEYFGAGAERVWIVRPRNRTITVHRPGGDAHTYGGASILSSDDAGFPSAGFELPLETLFAE